MSLNLGDSDRGITSAEVSARVIDITQQAIQASLPSAIDSALQDVPKLTGELRQGIKDELLQQASQQTNQATMTLRLRKADIVARVPHAEFQWLTGPTGKSTYDNPTIPGTLPVDPAEILNEVGRAVQRVVFRRLKGARLIQ